VQGIKLVKTRLPGGGFTTTAAAGFGSAGAVKEKVCSTALLKRLIEPDAVPRLQLRVLGGDSAPVPEDLPLTELGAFVAAHGARVENGVVELELR
jgi:hypothetical protein